MSFNSKLEGYLVPKVRHLQTSDERKDLVMRMRNGDEEARQRLIEENIPLVISIASEFWKAGALSLRDYIQEGVIALIRVLETYNPERSYLSCYAAPAIRRKIERAIAEKANIIKLHPHLTEDIQSFENVKYAEYASTGRWLKETEIFEKIPVRLKLQTIRKGRVSLETFSLDAPNPKLNGEKESYIQSVSDENVNVEDETFVKDSSKFLRTQLQSLNKEGVCWRDINIVRDFYGIGNKKPMNLTEVGKFYGLSKERIRQIKEKVETKLRKRLERKGVSIHDLIN